jgi:hypothetical protein
MSSYSSTKGDGYGLMPVPLCIDMEVVSSMLPEALKDNAIPRVYSLRSDGSHV